MMFRGLAGSRTWLRCFPLRPLSEFLAWCKMTPVNSHSVDSMSVIDYVTLSINRCSMPQGHLCRIDYTYHISADKASYSRSSRFHVECEVCGKTLLGEKRLGTEFFDSHDIASHDAMPVHRGFLIDCGLLDEAVGEDAIFVRLHVLGDHGDKFVAESPVVCDYF